MREIFFLGPGPGPGPGAPCLTQAVFLGSPNIYLKDKFYKSNKGLKYQDHKQNQFFKQPIKSDNLTFQLLKSSVF